MARLRRQTTAVGGDVPAWVTTFDPEAWRDPADGDTAPTDDLEPVYREVTAASRWRAAAVAFIADRDGVDELEARRRWFTYRRQEH
jgi:hypothetical protein